MDMPRPASVSGRRTTKLSGVLVVARETWRRAGSARTTLAFAVVFSLIALGVSYFGLAGQRTTGFQGFARVTAGLLNLVVYLVPLIALVLGVTEVTGRRETLAVILAQPVGRGSVLIGSYLGVAVALGTALAIGLGGAGVLIGMQTSTSAVGAYLVLFAVSFGLLLSFLSVAYLVGVILLDRLRSMVGAIVIWFLAVIGYDLGLIGISTILRGVPLKTILIPAILLNPVDIGRVLVTLSSGRGALFGPAGATLVEVFGSPGGAAIAASAFVLQIVTPLVLAVMVYRKRDL